MYILSKEESDRIRIIKFIAIIFVVYIHSYATEVNFSDGTDTFYLPLWLKLIEDGLSQVIASYGVPSFFLVSALLLFKSDYSYANVIRKKAKTLLLPYFIWNTFWIMVFIVLQALPFTAVYFGGANTPILQCGLTEWLGFYGIGKGNPQCYPLWFMRDLMVVLLFFPVIKALANRYPKILLGSSIMLMFVPFAFWGKVALAWFAIGAVIVRMRVHMDVIDRISMPAMGIIYLVGLIASLLSDVDIICNAFIFVGIAFWVRVSKEIHSKESIRIKFLWLSKWTFMIFVFHELTLSCVKKLCLRLLPTSPAFLFVEYALLPIFVTIGCIVVGSIFKKAFPKLYMLSMGKR